MTDSYIPLKSVAIIAPSLSIHSQILVGGKRRGRFQLAAKNDITPLFRIRCFIESSERCGDSFQQYHPKYLIALLGSITANQIETNRQVEIAGLEQFLIPVIDFQTGEWERRSMTLNAMRMSREFLDADSPRIIQLVESRLKVAQRDVVHDVLVYLVNQVEQMRESSFQARVLRAESIAAYLGVESPVVVSLLTLTRLDAARISRAIERGRAGKVRRALDVNQVVNSQLALLRPELNFLASQERRVWKLIDQITLRLYQLVK